MLASRRRRIARWTVIAVAAPVLLLTSYVSAWLCLSRAEYDGVITGQRQINHHHLEQDRKGLGRQ